MGSRGTVYALMESHGQVDDVDLKVLVKTSSHNVTSTNPAENPWWPVFEGTLKQAGFGKLVQGQCAHMFDRD